MTWTIQFFLMDVSNSTATKFAALSEMIASGSPCGANISRSLLTVADDVVNSIMWPQSIRVLYYRDQPMAERVWSGARLRQDNEREDQGKDAHDSGQTSAIVWGWDM